LDSKSTEDKYIKRGEFGELLLYHLLHEYFGADALISKIYFKDYLRESTLPKTPAFKNLSESNKIYLVENFRKVTNDGGWNYNVKTGEIHVNLPYNFFEQGIDWGNY